MNESGSWAGIQNPGERQPGIETRRHDAGGNLLAVVEPHARRSAPGHEHLCHGGLRADLDARLASSGRDRFRDGTRAAACKAPRAELAVDFSHVVVQQHVGRARGPDAEKGADDARSRHRRLERVGLEPLIQEVGGAHRHQLHVEPLQPQGHCAELAVDRVQLPGRPEVRRERVDRHQSQHGLDEPRHLGHGFVVLVVHGGVAGRVPRDLATRVLVIVGPPQVVAIRHRRERAVERQNLEAVPAELQLLDDLGTQERHDVRAHRELEAVEHFLGHGGAAQHVTAFEDQDLAARPRQVGGGRQPVVAAADDDRVIAHGAL